MIGDDEACLRFICSLLQSRPSDNRCQAMYRHISVSRKRAIEEKETAEALAARQEFINVMGRKAAGMATTARKRSKGEQARPAVNRKRVVPTLVQPETSSSTLSESSSGYVSAGKPSVISSSWSSATFQNASGAVYSNEGVRRAQYGHGVIEDLVRLREKPISLDDEKERDEKGEGRSGIASQGRAEEEQKRANGLKKQDVPRQRNSRNDRYNPDPLKRKIVQLDRYVSAYPPYFTTL